MSNNAQTEIALDVPVEPVIGARVAIKRSGSGGVIASVNPDMSETMYEIRTDNGGTAILKRSEFHTAHVLSWTCRCSPCSRTRMFVGRMMKGA